MVFPNILFISLLMKTQVYRYAMSDNDIIIAELKKL